jgi:hypothetical protein
VLVALDLTILSVAGTKYQAKKSGKKLAADTVKDYRVELAKAEKASITVL